METPTKQNFTDRFEQFVARIPWPLRTILMIWILLSWGHSVAPESVSGGLPTWVHVLFGSPMVLIGIFINIILLWAGLQTLRRVLKTEYSSEEDRNSVNLRKDFLGGIGALVIFIQIYIIFYFITNLFEVENTIFIPFSLLICITISYLVYRKDSRQLDVMIFLWGALAFTIMVSTTFVTAVLPSV